MKISVLKRDVSRYETQVVGQRKLRLRNLDIRNQPMIAAREYQRAVVAAKMERIFAKPFVHAFDGHLDTVKCIARCNRSVFDFFSGSCDGELRYWNLPSKSCQRSVVKAHEGFIEDICVNLDDKYVLTCGRDKMIKQWAIEKNFRADLTTYELAQDEGNRVSHTLIGSGNLINNLNRQILPVNTYLAASALTGVDYHDDKEWFASSGETIDIWDLSRSAPFLRGGQGVNGDSVNDQYIFVKWSPSETHLLLAGNANNSVGLFDTRQSMELPCQKISILRARSNACSWNPLRPFNFAVANDDGNIYTFDVRKLDQPRMRHFGFVHAALSVDFSPAGDELVGGSFDHTVRIWGSDSCKSREVYYNKRMQAVTAVRYTGDSKYILTGSADFNVRVWKSHANERVEEVVNQREVEALRYRAALKNKFKHMPEIENILTKRQVPKYIYNQSKKNKIQRNAEKKKEANRQANKSQGSKTASADQEADGTDDDDDDGTASSNKSASSSSSSSDSE